MITYRGRTTGPNVSAVDRAMLLRRLAALTQHFDTLVAARQLEAATAIRAECVECLRRLGVSPDEIRKLTSARGPLPSFAERQDSDDTVAVAADHHHDEGDGSCD